MRFCAFSFLNRYTRFLLLRVVRLGLFLGLFSQSVSALAMPPWLEGAGIYGHARSLTYSENMPIDAFDNDFEGEPPRDGNQAFSFNRYEYGFAYRDWYIARVKRFDYFFSFNSETFEIFYMDGNDIELPINVAYNAYLDVQKVDTEGFKVGRRWEVTDYLTLNTGLNYFEGDDVLYGSIEGRIWQSPTRIRGDLELNYIYTEDQVFDRPVIDPFTGIDTSKNITGHGYSFDLAAYWQVDRWRVALEWFDVAGRIDWKRVPYTRATMVSNRNKIDENGNPYRVPTLTAREGIGERTQVLPIRRRAEVEWGPWHLMTFAAEHEQVDRVRFNRVYWGVKPLSWFKVRGGYDFRSQKKSLEFWTPYCSLMVGSDRTDLKQSRNIDVSLSLQYAL